MANLIVEINADGIRYSITPPVVHHGDTVTFQVDGIDGEVAVSFDQPSCLTNSTPFMLNGSSQTTVSSSPDTVSLTAPKGTYLFNATIPDETTRRRYPNFDTKKGELEVATDPGKDKDKDKDKKK